VTFRRRIERSTKELGATLIDYNDQTGEWRFKVAHFSRYGLRPANESDAPPPTPPPPHDTANNTNSDVDNTTTATDKASAMDIGGEKENTLPSVVSASARAPLSSLLSRPSTVNVTDKTNVGDAIQISAWQVCFDSSVFQFCKHFLNTHSFIEKKSSCWISA
jgi:hypothetical protein